MAGKVAIVLIVLALGGCAKIRNATLGIHQQEFCYTAKPIYLQPGDVLTPATNNLIVGHNEKGEDLCGWRPPKKGDDAAKSKSD